MGGSLGGPAVKIGKHEHQQGGGHTQSGTVSGWEVERSVVDSELGLRDVRVCPSLTWNGRWHTDRAHTWPKTGPTRDPGHVGSKVATGAQAGTGCHLLPENTCGLDGAPHSTTTVL